MAAENHEDHHKYTSLTDLLDPAAQKKPHPVSLLSDHDHHESCGSSSSSSGDNDLLSSSSPSLLSSSSATADNDDNISNVVKEKLSKSNNCCCKKDKDQSKGKQLLFSPIFRGLMRRNKNDDATGVCHHCEVLQRRGFQPLPGRRSSSLCIPNTVSFLLQHTMTSSSVVVADHDHDHQGNGKEQLQEGEKQN